MYTYVKLKHKNIKEIKRINDSKQNFNKLNMDFWDIYSNSDFLGKIFLKRNFTLLTLDNTYIGYIWIEKKSKFNYYINALNIIEEKADFQTFSKLLDSLKNNCSYTFNCEKNSFNSKIIEKLGFNKTDTTYELYKDLKDFQYTLKLQKNITVETVNKGSKEKVRCRIQNEVFKNFDRVPLTLHDIYYDEMQSYYYEKGSILLKKDDFYIGYGQIIVESNIPTIVNFGILKDFRGLGYGKMLLNCLFNILKINNFEEIFIKVKADNMPAFNLYTQNGFKMHKQIDKWELKT